MWNNVIMHICRHFLHSAKRYQSGCPALRWQIPSLPPPPHPNRAERVSQPPVATVSGRRLFYTNRHCVLRRRAPKPGETLPAYKSRGCVTPTADCPLVNLSSDKRGCTNRCWWRQDWVLVDAVADLGQGLEIDRNSSTNSSCSTARNLGYRIKMGCGTLTWENRILILNSFGIGSYMDSWSYRRNQKGIVEPNLKNLIYNCVH